MPGSRLLAHEQLGGEDLARVARRALRFCRFVVDRGEKALPFGS
ncbi:hypothetical protein [Sorangium atrum]|uniref:Uncharacterized protein n=1 Tax=Sorangium atrum TaxID=2995308 RepID=A0ABT5C7B6_9BACT|nr:hypothetical protein [Sorangium aterium]MDC0682314.1 hypothetical protein [Sorangium aterium]